MTQQLDDLVEMVLQYATKLIGVKYTWWKGGPLDTNPHPFYIHSVPSITYIKTNGINCAGLINLLRQKAGCKVHESGGTVGWYDYFKKMGVLNKFKESGNYSIGTLLLRKYRDEVDQGHLAVCYSGKEPNINIIHAYDDDDCGTGIVDISKLRPDYNNYFEYTVSPKHWLIE